MAELLKYDLPQDTTTTNSQIEPFGYSFRTDA
jgi:hypothetical protein